jgi:hypothetical protein
MVALWLVQALAAGPTFASPELGPDDHCTLGNATSTENAFYARGFRGNPNADIFAKDADLYCQFRSFLQPPEGNCFDERDIFTGANVLSLGDTDREAVRAIAEVLGQIGFDFTVSAPAGAECSGFQTPVK